MCYTMTATSKSGMTVPANSFQDFSKTGGATATARTSYQSLSHNSRTVELNNDIDRQKV